MPPQNILISLRFAPLHQDILHRGLDKRQYSIYTEKGKRATNQPLSAQSHFSAVDCFYRVFFAEPKTQVFCTEVKNVISCIFFLTVDNSHPLSYGLVQINYIKVGWLFLYFVMAILFARSYKSASLLRLRDFDKTICKIY